MADIAISLVSKRRARALLIQKIQHALPSVVILVQGVRRLGSGSHGWSTALGLAEVVSSASVIGAFIWAVRAAQRATPEADARHVGQESHAHGVDWLDIFLGGMLATEAWSHWQETGHLPRPTALMAATMVVLGVVHGRFEAFHRRRRALRVSDGGLRVGGRFFRSFSAAWPDIARIDLSARYAHIVAIDGRVRKIDLQDLKNGDDVRAALESARKRLVDSAVLSADSVSPKSPELRGSVHAGRDAPFPRQDPD